MHVLGTRVPRRLGVARSASSPKTAQALGCSLTPGLRISFGRVTCMARAASVSGLWALGFLLLACVCGWVRVAVGRGFCLPLPVVAGVLGGCVWARFVVLSLFCWLFVVFVVGLWCGPAFGTCVVSCAFPLPPAVSGSGVRCGRPGLGCAPPFLAGLSGCVFCAFFFFFSGCWVSLSRALWSLPRLLSFGLGCWLFFFLLVSVSLFPVGRCRWLGVAGLGWVVPLCLFGGPVFGALWVGGLAPFCVVGGRFGGCGLFSRARPPPLFFFVRGGGLPGCSSRCLPSAGGCSVAGVWCGWSLATPGRGSCVLLPATPGWVSLPVVVGGPRHSWLGFAGGGGVWCVAVVCWWGCGWCVVWLVPRHSWRRSCVLLPATPGWVSLPVLLGGPRHSWLGSVGGVAVWCVVCGGGVLVALWLVCGVVGPSPLLAEVPVCYSPPLLAGFRCRWWWAVPATPGWGPLAAVVCGVWCVVCGGGVWVGLWLLCGVVGPSPLLAEVPVCYSPPLLAGFRCRWWWAVPATPGWGPLAAVVCGVWCVVCGGGVLVGLWLVCGVVGPSPLLAEVPVCYSPPLLAGIRCRWWWAVPATPGWGPLAALLCGVWCVALVCWWGCGWRVVWLVPRHSWRRFLCATPRHSWLGFAAGGGGRSPPLLAGVRLRRWCVVCGVWCVAVVCWWGCGWCVVWLVPRHSWRRFLCATPRHSWLGFAAAGGGRSPPLLAGVLWRRWCVVCCWGPSPLLAEVPVCYSPPLLAGFRCRWWWAVPATPGWGPLAAVVCVFCLAGSGGPASRARCGAPHLLLWPLCLSALLGPLRAGVAPLSFAAVAVPRWLGFVVCGLAVAWHLFVCRGSLRVVRALRVCGTRRPSLLGTCPCALVVAGGVPLWRASWPRVVRRASSGPVALGAPVGFPAAVVPFPTPGACAPGFTGRLRGARRGRPRTGLIVPAAGPRRSRGASSLRVIPIRGPAMGLSLAGPSGVGLGLRALRWLACVDPVTDASGFPYRPSFDGGLGRCTGAVSCGRRHLPLRVGGRHARVPCVFACACSSWPGRAGRPPGRVLVRHTFSFGRFVFLLCLAPSGLGLPLSLSLLLPFLVGCFSRPPAAWLAPRLCLPLGRWLPFGGCSPAPPPLCVSRFSSLLLVALVFFFFSPSSSSSVRPCCLRLSLVSGPGCPGPRRLRCVFCWPSASRLSVRFSLFRAFRLAVGCFRVVAAPPPPFVSRGFRSCRSVLCAVLCCASLGAVPLLVAPCPLALPVALGPCALRRCVLWCAPALCAPCCVCFVVARWCLLLFAALPCAVCVSGCCAVRSLCSPFCAVLCFAVLVPSRCAVRVVRAVAGAWCCGALLCVVLFPVVCRGAVLGLVTRGCLLVACFGVAVPAWPRGLLPCGWCGLLVCCGALLSCVVFCGAVLSRGAVLLCSAVVLRCFWGLLCPPVGCRAVLCCAVGWLCCFWPGGGVCVLWCSFPRAVRSLSSPFCALRCLVVLAVVPCLPVSCAVALCWVWCCAVVPCCRFAVLFVFSLPSCGLLCGACVVCAFVGASCCGVSLCVVVSPRGFCGVVVLLWCVVVSRCAVRCPVVSCALCRVLRCRAALRCCAVCFSFCLVFLC